MPTQPIDTLDGTLVLRLAYDGAGFSGFAEQPGQRTVAGETRRALETFLRRSIDLTCAGRTDAGVHARAYTYRIGTGEARPLLCREYAWWHRTPLDIAAMEEASRCLVGEHDFKSFCKVASAVGKPTCRNVHAVGFSTETQLGEELLAFTITGNAFLHSMVRTIVGSLVEVGSGRRDPAWMAEALAACDRRAAGPTAPARGLCFMSVTYDEGVLTVCS